TTSPTMHGDSGSSTGHRRRATTPSRSAPPTRPARLRPRRWPRPTPTARRATTRATFAWVLADVDHDLAGVRVGSHVPVGVGNLIEGVATVDDRAQSPIVEQRQHLGGEATGDGDLLLDRPGAQRRADPGRPPPHQRTDVDRHGPAAHQTDLDDAPLQRHRLEVAVDLLAADDVEDRVEPFGNGGFGFTQPIRW